MTRTITVTLLLTATLFAACGRDAVLKPLAGAGAKLEETSVSGVSSGAYMAGQFHVAHSSLVRGAGLVAGGPYGCAESIFADNMGGPGVAFINLSKARNGCMLDQMRLWGVPDPERLARRAAELALEDRIDPVSDLKADRVYLFSAKDDRIVVATIVTAAAQFYSQVGLAQDRIKLITGAPGGHAFLTDKEGLACGTTAEPYINGCGYDQAGAILAHIYGELKPRATEPAGELALFDQREFVAGFTEHGLADAGAVYTPRICRTGGCRVHVVFHGCMQGREKIQDAFVTKSGYLNWADGNRLIVLFPQVKASPVNPQGCWDWWGYTGREYLTRKGAQVTAVRRMLERLAQARG
jgi:poly(3-hydroxybutyrate) depolymerase